MKRKKSNRQKLVKKLDKIVSDIVRIRDDFTCQKCGKKIEKYGHVSHVIPRTHMFLRWDLWNLKLLCFYCHFQWWHKNPAEAIEWFQGKFPVRWAYLDHEPFSSLNVKPRFKVYKWTDSELEDKYNELKEKLEQLRNEK